MARKEKPVVTFDPKHHELAYHFDYNPGETKALRQMLRGKRPVSLCDLRRVALWKLDRILNIPDDVLDVLNSIVATSPLKVDSPESKKVLSDLVACPGVGFPMASAFLKFLRPDVFPIIDVRAYRALFGRKLYPNSYSLHLYLEYAARVEEIAFEKRIPLHEVDEQLWCFDRAHNGEINS